MGVFQVQNYTPQPSAPPCQPGSGDPGWPVDWTGDVQSFAPQVSVVLSRLDVMNRLYNGQWTHVGDPAYDAYLEGQMRTAVQVLSSAGGKVVFLTSPYYDSGEQLNGTPWPEDDPARVDTYNDLLRGVAGEFPGKAYVVDLNKLVDPDGVFAAVVDGVTVRFTDGVHWTFAGDTWLAPRLLPALRNVALGKAGSETQVSVTTVPPKD
jgi:hypothetical protein